MDDEELALLLQVEEPSDITPETQNFISGEHMDFFFQKEHIDIASFSGEKSDQNVNMDVQQEELAAFFNNKFSNGDWVIVFIDRKPCVWQIETVGIR